LIELPQLYDKNTHNLLIRKWDVLPQNLCEYIPEEISAAEYFSAAFAKMIHAENLNKT
jgi:hypothetical protein